MPAACMAWRVLAGDRRKQPGPGTALQLGRQHSSMRSRRGFSMRALPTPLPTTVEEISKPFEWANTAITFLWIPLILAPRWSVTKAVVKNELSAILPCLVFLYFFLSATSIDSSDPDELNRKVVFLFTEAITDPTKMATLATPAYMAQVGPGLGVEGSRV